MLYRRNLLATLRKRQSGASAVRLDRDRIASPLGRWSSARGERSSLSNASTIRRSLRPLNSRRNFLESASHPGPLDRQNSEVSLAWLAQTYPRGLAAEGLFAIHERLLA